MSSLNLLYRPDVPCVLNRELNFRQVPKISMDFISYSLTTMYTCTDFHELLLISSVQSKLKSNLRLLMSREQ